MRVRMLALTAIAIAIAIVGCGEYPKDGVSPLEDDDTTVVGGDTTVGGTGTINLFEVAPVASNEWDVAIRNIPVSSGSRVLRISWLGKQNPKVEVGHAKVADASRGAGQDHTSLVAPYTELTLTEGDNFLSITPWTGNTDVDGDKKIDDSWWLDVGLNRESETDRRKAADLLRPWIKAELR